MSPSHFLALDAPVRAEATQQFLPTLEAALTGNGPPLLPLPVGPQAVRAQLVADANPDRELEKPDIALLVPTSGSAGERKIVMLSRQAVLASVDAAHDALGGPGRWLLMMPTTHIAGLQVLTRSVVSGFPPVVVDLTGGFQPSRLTAAVGILLDHGGPEPRYAALVPTQLHRVLETGGAALAALVALDAVLLGGAAPRPALVARALSAGITLVQSYGMTETCGGCVYDGVPLAGVKISFDDANRIMLNGPMMFSGYRAEPALTSRTLQHGTVLTSDYGHLDEHHRLVVDGRVDDVVVTGGVNVACTQVERELSEHPAIREVVVVGIADEEWGQRVVAVAVVDGTLSLESLRTFGRNNLDASALPRQLVTVDALPLLPSGKVDRLAVTALVEPDH